MPIVEVRADQLRAGDHILDRSGRQVKITGIAEKPAGKRKLIIEHEKTWACNVTDIVHKVITES